MTQSTIHQTHLESAKEQLQGILNEVQQLNNQVASKRETALKVQGVIEYLEQIVAVEQQPPENPLDSMPVATPDADETAVNTALS
jgi:flagellar biosynthesis chaperone FliJ|tara:strand:- start:1088 stop:1342 length:255 start_codon:yes stop_codon:yes gene_type:complete